MRAGVIYFLLHRGGKLFQEFQGISPSSNLRSPGEISPNTYQGVLRIIADLDDVRPLAYKGFGK